MKKRKKLFFFLFPALLLLCVLLYSLYQIILANREYSLQEKAYEALEAYRPGKDGSPAGSSSTQDPSDATAAEPDASASEPGFVNEDIRRLRKDHPNAIGWISIPGTTIEFPFVQGPDNEYFLRRDVDGNYLYAGVPFLDYRCMPDCSGANTIFYGHNLRNGSMFGPLEKFREQSFFDEHREILIYLEDRTIRAEIAACLVTDPGENEFLYEIDPDADHLQRLTEKARCSAAIAVRGEARFITLSTCGYEFNGARIVLVGIVIPE